jgi:hypothetical protein
MSEARELTKEERKAVGAQVDRVERLTRELDRALVDLDTDGLCIVAASGQTTFVSPDPWHGFDTTWLLSQMAEVRGHLTLPELRRGTETQERTEAAAEHDGA